MQNQLYTKCWDLCYNRRRLYFIDQNFSKTEKTDYNHSKNWKIPKNYDYCLVKKWQISKILCFLCFKKEKNPQEKKRVAKNSFMFKWREKWPKMKVFYNKLNKMCVLVSNPESYRHRVCQNVWIFFFSSVLSSSATAKSICMCVKTK